MDDPKRENTGRTQDSPGEKAKADFPTCRNRAGKKTFSFVKVTQL